MNPLLAAVNWLKYVFTAPSRLREWEKISQIILSITYNSSAMGCGLEDQGISDRYESAEYGWNQCMNKIIELMPEDK